ncbi:helix-turn-helix domain-containing protein [Saccharopolyspora erythraea]|uniref:helix-turn-helix domain-containing protein n=1 Tax=Saccharopolyspora erythraea TaxID=1836 RepID=UPI001BAB685C|nr:helix-turn-helix transcriptional regulator [Saccharopolyspora erythraea]QUH03841.1 helix-turn-helix domain-containing protein [Saccharopolyspora erythraea]
MTLRRQMLGRSLAEWREHAGVTRSEVAAELGCTADRVRHLESGRNVPTRPDLIVMCALYGVPDADREVLLATRAEAQKPGWWQTYRLPSWLASYVTLETEAARVRNWEGELIPGLLQTEGYARRVAELGHLVVSSAEADKRIAARLHRQQRLTADQPLALDAVISEAAIERCAAEPGIAADQLAHLLKMLERPNVTIRVLPIAAGLHQAMAGSFALLDFDPGTWPETGYQEYAVGGHLVDDAEAVSTLGSLFAELQERALTESDSARLILQYHQRSESR